MIPRGEPAERAKAARAEGVFAIPVNKRPLPDLATSATLPRALEYAFNASGEIEASYREWRAALERIPQAGALADPKLDFSFLFDAANLGSFTGILNSVRIMASQELPAKGKREAKASQALAEAQAAGEKFRAARFALQKRVVQAYADLALNRALVNQTSDTLRLLGQSHEVALHRYHEGGDTVLADLRKFEVEIQTAESDQRALQIQQSSLVAALNGILNRKPDAPVGQLGLPRVEAPPTPDAELFARAVRGNPELASLRREIEARGAAQVLAGLEKRPDYTIGGGLDNPLMPIVTLSMTLPINHERIRAGIAEMLQNRQAAEARLRSAEFDTQARLVMALAILRDAERVTRGLSRRHPPQDPRAAGHAACHLRQRRRGGA
ncbi:TolC family protein [uncultured Desulfobulbus sp.]|uniref:TolC family protein n=1 Tax=uncultured Desulfobulbus sp. TaxID=239745 RepID=UPI0029C62ABE|nr:TolC family protein [uncultured Desulfobulbus sp.]